MQQPEVQQTQVTNSTFERRNAPGTSIVVVNGGTIGGNLNASGSGTGAATGSLGANILMNGTLTGNLAAFSFDNDQRTVITDVANRTSATNVDRTITTVTTRPPSFARNGVLVNIGGSVGGIVDAGTNDGSATVNLTGQINTRRTQNLVEGQAEPAGIRVAAFYFPQTSESVRTSSGNSFFFTGATTSLRTTTSNAPAGGAATLNIAADAATRAVNASSVEGNINVFGFGGSAINIAAGSRVLQAAGDIFLGSTFGGAQTVTTGTFTNGIQTGSTSAQTLTFSGGPATLTNAGIIGSTANTADVTVNSATAASVVNSGTINGAVVLDTRANSRMSNSTTTDFNNPLLRRTVTTTVTRPMGGVANLANSGLVTGGVTAVGSTGTIANSGVIRGLVTLGGGFNNFTTRSTTTTAAATNTTPQTTTTTSAPSVANATLINQSYTVNQNGLLLDGVLVTGVNTVDPSGATLRTSNVAAAINLNEGSITLGNITAEANTVANVALNGSGFLGIAALDTPTVTAGQPATTFASTPSITRFVAVDPSLNSTIFAPGSRVTGVQKLTKAGAGTFTIVGAPLAPAAGTLPITYTLDVGAVRVTGGELQLGVAGPATNIFGIRGNVENSANLVLGRRIVSGTQTAIQGINLSVLGNVTNAAAGNLIVGVNATFVRPVASGPFVAFTPASPLLRSTNSFVQVDGNLNLAGTVLVQSTPGGLFEAGRVSDLFSVGGTYATTGTVRSGFASPFVTFTLTPRTEGGRTIVSLDVSRAAFNTVTTDANATAAANAFQPALPSTFAALRTGGDANAQDLAGIISLLDTQLTADGANQAFQELSSGEIYGSLAAVSTTIPFGEATDGLPTEGTDSGIGLWFRPTGQFALYKSNRESGASEIEVDNYGGSLGIGFATGSGGHIGIGGGYAKLDVNATTSPEDAEAKTYMAGIYGVQQIGGLHLSAQAVYGSSEWDVSRVLPTLGRAATGEFNSTEIRVSARAAYTVVVLPNFDISPFVKAEFRRTKLDAFTEVGAGAVSLNVARNTDEVFSPEVGLRMAGLIGTKLRPFAEGSYVFQGDVRSDRTLSFVGVPGAFITRGVDPGNAIKAAIGVVGHIAGSSAFIRGDYHSGGRQQVGTLRGGLLISF